MTGAPPQVRVRAAGALGGEHAAEIARFLVVGLSILYLASLALNTSVNSGLLSAASPRLLAWFVATGASTISNYLGMKLVVFREGGS